MNKIKQFKFKNAINLYCFTDVHIGAKEHDSVKFKKAVDMCKKDPDGYCFFNGDTVEFIPPNYGIPESGQVLDIEKQLDTFEEFIKSLKNKILFIRAGNHEMRGWKLSGADPIQRMAKTGEIAFLNEGMEEVHVYVQGKKLRLVTSHGEGGGAKKTLLTMSKTFPGADLYFIGHTHGFKNHADGEEIILTDSGEEIQAESAPMLEGGSFLGWADYARALNRQPTKTGCYVLSLSKDGLRVKGKIA
jgi:hypothetical protein